MVLFHYTMTRNGDHAKELLDRWHGSLVTDAYAGYEKVEKIIHGLCWSHVRRKYINSIPLDSSGKEIPRSKCAEARANATAYSLIETARSYDLNVYEYIHYVLKRIPMLDHQSHPENLEELMPWSKDLPKECYRTNNPEKDEESFDHSENI